MGLLNEIFDSGLREHRIQPGESLGDIAQRYYDDYQLWPIIYEANKVYFRDPNDAPPGLVIAIPYHDRKAVKVEF